MKEVTSADFQKNFGLYKRQALAEPVTIRIHGRPTLVVLSAAEYERLTKGLPPRGPIPVSMAEPNFTAPIPDFTHELAELEKIASSTPSGFRFDDDLSDDMPD